MLKNSGDLEEDLGCYGIGLVCVAALLVGRHHCDLVQALELDYSAPTDHLTLRNLQSIFSFLKFCHLINGSSYSSCFIDFCHRTRIQMIPWFSDIIPVVPNLSIRKISILSIFKISVIMLIVKYFFSVYHTVIQWLLKVSF